MSDPQRLRSSSDNELERLLLRAGRGRAPAQARQRALLAATAALGTGLVSGSAAAGAIGAKTGSILSLKWLAVVGLAGVGAMTAAVVIQGRPASPNAGRVEEPPVRLESAAATARTARARPTAPTGSGQVEPVEPTVPVELAATEAPPAPFVGAPAPWATATAKADPSATLRSAPSVAGTSVPAELATLDQARGALAAGEPARALAILDSYTVTYPRAAMAPEATVLRIEALVRAGDRPAAERLGTAFLESHPQSPYAARIRSLLGRTNP
jgi:hypothetical protein